MLVADGGVASIVARLGYTSTDQLSLTTAKDLVDAGLGTVRPFSPKSSGVHPRVPSTAMGAEARCAHRSCQPTCWSFGDGHWTGAEVGLSWKDLAIRKCWVKRSHKQRRVPVWFDDVLDGQSSTSCSQLAGAHWSAMNNSHSMNIQCGAARHNFRHKHAKGFQPLVSAANMRPMSLLLVGDSVDRKMWEALNNSRMAAMLHAAGVCVAWTPVVHSPELALSWLTDPKIVAERGAQHAASEIRELWRSGRFESFAHLDKGHDELANHAAVFSAAGRSGVPRPWSTTSTLAAGSNRTAKWKVIHGRPDVCRGDSPPRAIVLSAAYHVLFSYLRYSQRFPRNSTDPAAMPKGRFPYMKANQSLPRPVIERYVSNLRSYARKMQDAFPETPIIALRTAPLLDYIPFSKSRKYARDWEASPSLNTYSRQLNEGVRTAAAAERLTIFDVERMLEPLAGNPGSYLEEDNLHPNPAIALQVLRAMLASVAAAEECHLCGREDKLHRW